MKKQRKKKKKASPSRPQKHGPKREARQGPALNRKDVYFSSPLLFCAPFPLVWRVVGSRRDINAFGICGGARRVAGGGQQN